MLLSLIRRLRPLRVSDPLFGPLRYQRSGQFWEGSTPFPPLGTSVEVLINAPDTGPSETHRVLWRELVARYPDLLPHLTLALQHAQREAYSGRESAYVRDMLAVDTFQLVAIELSSMSESEVELSFEGTASGGYFNVPVSHWRPGTIVVEQC